MILHVFWMIHINKLLGMTVNVTIAVIFEGLDK